MLASGNGLSEVCAGNLVRITRGEVPYERLKGIDAGLIDKPSDVAVNELVADTDWLFRTYEPRVDCDKITLDVSGAQRGQHTLGVKLRA